MRKNWQILTVNSKKKINRKNCSCDHNGKILAVSGKLPKILTANRKSHHLETLNYNP